MANKINASKEDLIVGYLSNDWNTFYDDKILNWSNLFNRKLCYEEKSGNFFGDYYEYDANKNTTTQETNNEKETNEYEDNKEENNENENVKKKLFYFRLKTMRRKMIKRIQNMI